MTALPSFGLTGTLEEILGGVVASELVESAMSRAKIQFVSNVPTDRMISWGGKLYRVGVVDAIVNTDGIIVLDDGDETPVRLLAQDDGLSIRGLQWQVRIHLPSSVLPPLPYEEIRAFWFDAIGDGLSLNLDEVTPTVGLSASAAMTPTSMSVNGLYDATTFGKTFLTDVVTAADARTKIGVDLIGLDEMDWYDTFADFPSTGQTTNKVYGAQDTGRMFRWSGVAYVPATSTPVDIGVLAAQNNAQSVPPVHTDWTSKSDGTVFPATEDTGDVAAQLNGSVGTGKIHNGQFTLTPSGSGSSAVYRQFNGGAAITRLGANFTFGAERAGTTRGGALGIAMLNKAIASGLTDTSVVINVHFAMNPDYWTLSHASYVGSVLTFTTVAQQYFPVPLKADGTVYRVEVYRNGTTVTLCLPDGQVVSYTDANFATGGGTQGFVENFCNHSATDNVTGMLQHWWATGAQTIPSQQFVTRDGALGVASSRTGTHAGANLVLDGNFADPTSYAALLPGAVTTDQAYNGAQSWALTATGVYQEVNWIRDTAGNSMYVPAQGDRVFRWEAKIRKKSTNAGGGTLQLGVGGLNADTTAISYPGVLTITPNTDLSSSAWTTFSGYGTLPAATVLSKYILAVQSTVPVGDVFYVDALVCEDVTEAWGRLPAPTTTKTSAYTAVAGDLVLCDSTTAGFPITLPPAPADKTRIVVKIVAGANTVTVVTGGTDKFNTSTGGTTLTLQLLNQAVVLQYSKVAGLWYVISTDAPLGSLDARYGRAAKLYFIDNYGADPTGVANSDAALAAAKTAMGTSPGILVFGVGTYRLTVPCPSSFGINQSVVGQGIAQTMLQFTGTGTLFTAHDPRSYTFTSPGGVDAGVGYGAYGGFWGPLTIDGSGAAAGSIGLELGDMSYMRGDVQVQNFSGAGSIGVYFINRYTWTEKTEFRILSINNTQGVKLEGGAGTGIGGTGGTASLGYSRFDLVFHSFPNQDGLVLTNGASLYHGELRIRGNFASANSVGGNTGTVLKIGEANILNSGVTDNSRITDCHIDIGVEANGDTGSGSIYAAKTIVLSASGSAQIHGYGMLRFWSTGGINFQTGNATGGKVHFAGIVDVDSSLGKMTSTQQVARDLTFRGGSLGSMPANGGTIFLSTSGNMIKQTLTSGAWTYTVDSSSTDKVGTGETGVWDILLKQPASGSATVTWPSGFVWLSGTPAVLSTTPGASDHIRVVTYDFTNFYAWHVNAAPAITIASAGHAASAKTTPVDNDELLLIDSAASNTLAKLTFANLKAWVKSLITAATVGPKYFSQTYKSGNYYFANSGGNTSTSVALGNGTARTSEWIVPAAISISALFAEYTVAGQAGSVFRIGIWNDDGTGQPGTLLLDAGTIATDGTPGVTAITGLSTTLQPGIYHVGGAVQSAGTTQPTMRTVAAAALLGVASLGTSLPGVNAAACGYQNNMAGALTAFSSPTASGLAVRVGFKIA